MANKLAQALTEVATRHQHVIVGDTEHDMPQIPKAMADPAIVAGLANAGVKHIFLELPASTQPLLNLLTEGVITPAGFAQTMASNPLSMRDEKGWQAIGELAQRASQQHGIKIYAADERADHIQEHLEAARKGLGTDRLDFESVAAYLKRTQPAQMPDGSIEGPLTNDQPLADFIKRKAGNEKSLIMFGESHGGRPYDLDEMLGNAARCQLFAKESGYAESMSHYRNNRFGYSMDPDPPAVRFFIDTQRIEFPNISYQPPAPDTAAPQEQHQRVAPVSPQRMQP